MAIGPAHGVVHTTMRRAGNRFVHFHFWSACGWVIIGLLALLIVGKVEAGSEQQATEAGRVFRDCPDCPEMVVIPQGTFLMGSSAAQTAQVLESMPSWETNVDRAALATEQPQHSVAIGRSFALSKYPVTRAQFAAFVRETGYLESGGCRNFINHRYPLVAETSWQNPGFAQTDQDPVVCVNWQDAKAYVAWLNSKTSVRSEPYRLSSEAEMEYAARAGTQTTRWWGDRDAAGLNNANCNGCGSRWDKKQTAPVGSFVPNPFGLFDVVGNVWQWTEDCWNKNYSDAPSDGRAWTTGDCDYRALRGGSWASVPWLLRPAVRIHQRSAERANYVGFRVARSLF